MTVEEATVLRQAWKAKGNQSCDHTSVAMERTANGYLTGKFVCKVCGSEVPNMQK